MPDIQQTELHKVVVGAIKGAFAAHGPVTPELTGSAAKRITAAVIAHLSQDKELVKEYFREHYETYRTESGRYLLSKPRGDRSSGANND